VGRSLLTDQPLRLEAVQGLDFMKGNPRFMQPNYAANIRATDALRAFATDRGVPAAALAITWLLAQGDHVIPIPGTRSVAHFRELVQGAHITLAPDDLAEIARILPVGWAHGDRYSDAQWVGPERYC
jgi:aryl-alcohol dehydrogenase-like predicted oxidoreductase